MHNPRIRVLVVDDHAVVRGGLRFFLAGAVQFLAVANSSQAS